MLGRAASRALTERRERPGATQRLRHREALVRVGHDLEGVAHRGAHGLEPVDVLRHVRTADLELRAEEARLRAEESLKNASRESKSFLEAEMALRRSNLRLNVARRRRGPGPMGSGGDLH